MLNTRKDKRRTLIIIMEPSHYPLSTMTPLFGLTQMRRSWVELFLRWLCLDLTLSKQIQDSFEETDVILVKLPLHLKSLPMILNLRAIKEWLEQELVLQFNPQKDWALHSSDSSQKGRCGITFKQLNTITELNSEQLYNPLNIQWRYTSTDPKYTINTIQNTQLIQ